MKIYEYDKKNEKTGEILSHVFFCDPNSPWQKGSIEKNHEYIRYILPKGTSFNALNQEKVNLLSSHINNTYRDSINGKTPYEAIQFNIDKQVIKKLGISSIHPNDVNLSPNLIK